MCERVFIFMNTLEYKPLCTIHEYEYKRVCSIHDSEYVFKLLLPQWRHLARAASLGPWAWLCARCVPWDCHWVGEDESYGTDRCIRASYRLSRSYETVEPHRDACRRPGGQPEDASTAPWILPSSAGTPKSRTYPSTVIYDPGGAGGGG